MNFNKKVFDLDGKINPKIDDDDDDDTDVADGDKRRKKKNGRKIFKKKQEMETVKTSGWRAMKSRNSATRWPLTRRTSGGACDRWPNRLRIGTWIVRWFVNSLVKRIKRQSKLGPEPSWPKHDRPMDPIILLFFFLRGSQTKLLFFLPI